MASLTTAERKQLVEHLQQRKQALIAEVRQALADSENRHFRDIAGQVTDQGDESVADFLADLDVALIDRHVQELRDIDAAQARMQSGQYGVCVVCESPIGFARLEAYPTAKRCIACQARHEKQHAHPGEPSL